MLQLKKLTFSAPIDSTDGNAAGKDIIKDLDLDVEAGKLIVITGPNGGGKSTLAKLIAGIYETTSGQILFNGEDITALDVTERAKKGVSFAFQRPVCFKGFTVGDMLDIAARRQLTLDEKKNLLGRVGLCVHEYGDREINQTLSGGELKRIEIATVLARETKLNIFDEPEAGIDIWSFGKLISVFRQLAEDKSSTQIIISHQRSILEIADEIIVICGGEIVNRGTPAELLPNMFGEGGACPVGRRCN